MWLPIESAPKDKTILLYRPGSCKQIVCGRWNTDEYAKTPRPYWSRDWERIGGTMDARTCSPTHWMPLPEPPGEEVSHG